MRTIEKSVMFLLFVLATSVSSTAVFGQDVKPVGTVEGNRTYLESWKGFCTDSFMNLGNTSNRSNPLNKSCKDWMDAHENQYPIPSSTKGLDVYEAGFIADVCSRSYQNDDYNDKMSKWQDNRSYCFATALGQSQYTNLSQIVGQCKGQDHTCYENHLKTAYSTNEPTCEEKLNAIQATLQQSNAAMANGNARELKNILQAVSGEVNKGAPATSAK
jgi:hypothetical protein